MRSVLGGLALLALSAALSTPPLAAQPTAEPWEGAPFSADPAALARAAAALPADGEGEPVAVLLSDARYSYDEAGRETYTHHVVYKITSATADESWSTVEEHWAPWHQARPEVRARVVTPDGTAHPLDAAVLTEGGEA
jgi:hypothetical protein